jgi:hypothetical protein
LVFDDLIPDTDETRFETVSWKEFYGEMEEPIPSNQPAPRGNEVHMRCYCDADHAGNVVTRRSQTGIMIFLNNAPIVWYSKRQNTVETSTFGSELVALRVTTEIIEALRYKLRMFGIPIAGPCDVFCDNESAVRSTSVPTSTLNKKHNSIAYHKVREAAAMGMLRVTKEPTETNCSDLFTKCLTTPRRRKLLEMIVGGF